jgi:preprotein translocase subunit SecA
MALWPCFAPPRPPRPAAAPHKALPKDEPRGRLRERPLEVGKKVGRNAPCPCGSGKKYKKCCGAA